MRELLTHAFGWFCGGLLFAGLIDALAQVGGFTRARSQRGSARDKRQCTRVVRTASRYPLRSAIRLEWFLAILAGLMAASITRSAAATLAVLAGALAGPCLSRRRDWREDSRAVAAVAAIVGMTALGSGAGGFFAATASVAAQFGVRFALFSAVALGASLLGAAVVARTNVRTSLSRRRERAVLTSADRALQVFALLLCAALGQRFVATLHATELGLSILGATSVLGVALGAQFMLMSRQSVIRTAPAETCRGSSHAHNRLDNRAASVARYTGCAHAEQYAPRRQQATSRRHATL